MKQVTNLQDLKALVNKNGEMVITVDGNNIVLMKIEEYNNLILKKEIEKHLLKAEDDIESGKTRNAREVFKEWKKQCGI